MKNKFYQYSFVIVATSLLSIGCEGEKCADGIVYDAQTGVVLDSVLYKRLGKDSYEIYTDSTGTYEMCGKFGACNPECPDFTIEFSKSGYVSQRHRNPGSKDIYLERED